MLKDEQYCSYNGGGVSRPLISWSDFSTLQYRIIISYRFAWRNWILGCSSDWDDGRIWLVGFSSKDGLGKTRAAEIQKRGVHGQHDSTNWNTCIAGAEMGSSLPK